MNDIINQCFFICIGITFHYFYQFDFNIVIPLLIATCTSSFCALLPSNRLAIFLPYMFLLGIFFSPTFVFYVPLMLLHAFTPNKFNIFYLLFVIAYLLVLPYVNVFEICLSCCFALFAMILKKRTLDNQIIHEAFMKQRDTTKELANALAQRNQSLLEQQGYEIKIATLGERNRIAREIHDNVGHLLSSSLLQVGALQAIHQNVEIQVPLRSLRTTISSAMDSVRSSVHDLHDEAIDFEVVLTNLLDGFEFCKTSLDYRLQHPFKQRVMEHLLAILKECLNNTMKHSNATLLEVIVREQHDFYQFIIHDNGHDIHLNNQGIGLENMKERVHSIHGYININTKEGFQVFITLPKEESK